LQINLIGWEKTRVLDIFFRAPIKIWIFLFTNAVLTKHYLEAIWNYLPIDAEQGLPVFLNITHQSKQIYTYQLTTNCLYLKIINFSKCPLNIPTVFIARLSKIHLNWYFGMKIYAPSGNPALSVTSSTLPSEATGRHALCTYIHSPLFAFLECNVCKLDYQLQKYIYLCWLSDLICQYFNYP
jgi:hypothetical protein